MRMRVKTHAHKTNSHLNNLFPTIKLAMMKNRYTHTHMRMHVKTHAHKPNSYLNNLFPTIKLAMMKNTDTHTT